MDCDVTALNDSSRLFFRLRTETNETDGSVTLFLYSRDPIWGDDVSTDEEANTLRIALKPYPKLSENLSKPLEGVTIAVASGDGSHSKPSRAARVTSRPTTAGVTVRTIDGPSALMVSSITAPSG